MENRPTCRKCYETEDGVRGFLLECSKCTSWIHPGCHKPNVNVATLKAMILVSDRAQGVPGSLEAWSCRDCSQNTSQSIPQRVQETIDLTLDSDSDDAIQVVEPPQPQRVKQEVKRENRGVLQGNEGGRWEIRMKETSAATAALPAFKQYNPPPYLDTLIKNREATAKAYLQSLFPPNHTRTDHQLLFDTKANPVDNPFSQWLLPEQTMNLPISNSQRHRRKPVAKYKPSSSTSSDLQETSWASWGTS